MSGRRRILVTGMNKTHVVRDFYRQQQLQVVLATYSLVRCLEDMGYDVDHRHVEIGEDISYYDDVIAFVHSPGGFCPYLWEGLYAIAARPDCIVSFDDWQFDQIMGSLSQYRQDLLRNDEHAFRDYLFETHRNGVVREDVVARRSDYISAIDCVFAKRNRLLVSAFVGGDPSMIVDGWDLSRVYVYNPNPYHLRRRPENHFGVEGIGAFIEPETFPPEKKARVWNFSSLKQEKTARWLKAQGEVTWPIEFFGTRKLRQRRLTEPEMCRVYAEQWGCLMPGYYHSGSGWWRTRVLQVADAGSILVCDDAEAAVFGEAYVGVRVPDVESMDTGQLDELARRQRECLYDNHPLDKSVQREQLRAVLDASR